MRFYILEDDFSVLLSPDIQAISHPIGYIDIVEPDELALVLYKNVGCSYEVFTVSYSEETNVDCEELTGSYTDRQFSWPTPLRVGFSFDFFLLVI